MGMVYLPTFTIKISQMWVNIPYMDDMGSQTPNISGDFGCLGIDPKFQRDIPVGRSLTGVEPHLQRKQWSSRVSIRMCLINNT